ncbi:MAG: sugar-transfer associated ATP-grasp domain-containing protein [Desulfomicrobium sp.]|nr:sugar-transfer associated ATP-grasp domain-containing protein [Desulfomicrobium sp.]
MLHRERYLSYLIRLKNFLRSYLFNFRSNKQALGILKELEHDSGRKLSTQEKKEIDRYAQKKFGHKKYAPWLYVYSQAGRGVEGYIPENYYFEVLLPKLKGFYGQAARYKPLNKKFFRSDAFPDIGSYINGLFLNSEFSIIPLEEIQDYLFSHHDKIIFKIDKSCQGKGIYVFDKKNFTIDKIIKLGNGVFQYFIEQHDFFNQFHGQSVGTIRVTTFCKKNGDIEILAGFFKFNYGKLDYVRSADAVYVPVDINSGALGSTGYFINWQKIEKHFGIGISFQGFIIPEWDKLVQTAKTLHQQVPFVRCIGWDMTVDKNNKVQVMEWNGYYNGIGFHEFTSGPIFEKVADEIMP